MLRRTGFKRKVYVPARSAPLRPLFMPVIRVSMSELLVSFPKGEPAKPGKRAPTAQESRWMAAIVEYGCIACRLDHMDPRPTCVHHILRGGVRMGHLFTLGLCHPGHHMDGAALGLVSRHPWKKRFEEKYGTEEELLAKLRAEIGVSQW